MGIEELDLKDFKVSQEDKDAYMMMVNHLFTFIKGEKTNNEVVLRVSIRGKATEYADYKLIEKHRFGLINSTLSIEGTGFATMLVERNEELLSAVITNKRNKKWIKKI